MQYPFVVALIQLVKGLFISIKKLPAYCNQTSKLPGVALPGISRTPLGKTKGYTGVHSLSQTKGKNGKIWGSYSRINLEFQSVTDGNML